MATTSFDPLWDEEGLCGGAEGRWDVYDVCEYDDLIHGVMSMFRAPMNVAGGHDVLEDVGGDLYEGCTERALLQISSL